MSGESGTSSGLLAVLFIALKLCHVINWSWWWVLAPVWIPLVVVVLILTTWLLVGGNKTPTPYARRTSRN